MRAVSLVRALPAFAVGGLALTLGGCAGITYGTGVRAELQTIEDVSNIATLSAKEKEEIDYKPRGGIVVPPTANLPPPADEKKKVAAAGDNWPVDQDIMARKVKNERVAKASETNATPGADPGFRLPKGTTAKTTEVSDKEGFKRLAAAKAAQSGFDANGKPIRKFLTEPPAEYREPDPSAPATLPEEKKKKKWWPFGGG